MFNNLSANNKNNKENKKVDVMFYYSGADNYARPVALTWKNIEYKLDAVQFWYEENGKNGDKVHHYRVSDEEGLYTFDLSLETNNLTWSLNKVTSSISDSNIFSLNTAPAF